LFEGISPPFVSCQLQLSSCATLFYLPLNVLIMERQIIEKLKHRMWIIGLGQSKVGSWITDSVNFYSLSEKNMLS